MPIPDITPVTQVYFFIITLNTTTLEVRLK